MGVGGLRGVGDGPTIRLLNVMWVKVTCESLGPANRGASQAFVGKL